MNGGVGKLFDDLRSMHVVVVHPPGEECDILVDQLRRIGCRVRTVWPFPVNPPGEADVIFFRVEPEQVSVNSWRSADANAVLIALVDYENPTALKALLDTNARGVITKPFRPSGILSTLVLACSSHGYELRLLSKVKKLEDTLRARRDIEKAIKILVERKRVTEAEAYEQMRRQATTKRVSVVEIAATIVSANTVLGGLGLLD